MSQVKAAGVDWSGLIAVQKALRNRGLSKPLLATATTVQQIKTTNVFEFMIDGVMKSKVATDGLGSMAALTVVPNGQLCTVRIEIDAAGTVTFNQGPIDPQGDKYALRSYVAGAAVGTPPSNSRATIGVFITPAGGFTFNTTSVAGGTFIDGDPDLFASALMAGQTQGLES